MTAVLQVGSQALQADEVASLLHRYQLMPQLVRGMAIDRAIAQYERTTPVPYTQEEQIAAIAAFEAQHGITPDTQAAWLHHQGLTLEQLQALATRSLLIEKFKVATWAHKVEPYFLARKSEFDRVVYSLLRTKSLELAYELYFRILEGEQSFADLAKQYSQGPEAETGGLLGPVPLSKPHAGIARLLSMSKPGQLWTPRPLANWFVIIRLEQFIPAQLDDAMRQHLMNELFEHWLQEQVRSGS